jgi:anti-sigma factor RsiW
MPGVRNIELVILGALIVSAPSLIQAFSGGISLSTALLRLGIALALCWAAGAIVERVVDSYARESRRRMFKQEMARLAEARSALVEQHRSQGER